MLVTYLLALIGTRATRETDIDDVLTFHLQHPAFWSNTRHDRWAKGSRVVTKVAGAGVLALTGVLDCLHPEHDPLDADDQHWDWRYDVLWDSQPPHVVPVSELGAPFDGPTRSVRKIAGAEYRRAYRALHGRDPPRQDHRAP